MEKKYKETKLQTCDISVVSECTFHTIEKKKKKHFETDTVKIAFFYIIP